ncbi:MAG: DUF5060 domain-containing protein [Bacteroidota bacterium]
MLRKNTVLKAVQPLVAMAVLFLSFQSCGPETPKDWKWETLQTVGQPTARHEAGFVAYKEKLYLMGGRRVNPTSEFDTKTNTWREKAAPPLEIHHFQPVVLGDAIYILGAMTGPWPNETPLEKVLVYYPEKDKFEFRHEIPEHRRRGGAGAVVYNDKIYLVGGITNGHMNGFQPWFDEYDPKTGAWKTLADAPFPRDHFQAVATGGKLYAFAGRTTSKISNRDMALTLSHGNVYDFEKGHWEPVRNALQIPTPRAGNAAFAWNGSVVIGGGESIAQVAAHAEVEAFHTDENKWVNWPSLQQGRHGSGFAVVGNYVYTASGCGNRGGEPELTTIERLKLPKKNPVSTAQTPDTTPVYSQWHTISLSFKGPETSEMKAYNPFLNYVLKVEFRHEQTQSIIRGFYAADGNAAESGADTGAIWQVRFTPDKTGTWTYAATLHKGKNIALEEDMSLSESVPLQNSTGTFMVIPSYKEGNDFSAKGKLTVENGYFKFQNSDRYFLKVGANSPENFLAYVDFDNTYRMEAEAREGEAAAPEHIHQFTPHLKDWKTGDPVWKETKGKAIVGAVNYLASKGMNAIYFLTMNIGGDGKDVWPYCSPDDFTRFDVSKLEQWELLFRHMQSKGVLLHVVLQETENETLLDNGDTGAMRQLYYRELIARFGHHLALVWNLGEENGPASWSPVGQNDAQRKAMAQFIKKNDPYQHPVLLHTHSYDPLRHDILKDLLGFPYLDGLSLQQDKRENAPAVMETWSAKAKEAGHEWLITMDEIGMWHTGALSDTADVNHPTLTHYALWGTLLSGGAGVEWYFGAKHPNNDLNSEDWRMRDQLWDITHHAKVFFQNYLPWWEMQPEHRLINLKEGYCFRKKGEVYAIYLPKNNTCLLDLSQVSGEFSVAWYDPLHGGELAQGTVTSIQGGGTRVLGKPPVKSGASKGKDWVVLVRKQ